MNGMLFAVAVEALSITVLIGGWLWFNWQRRKTRQTDVEVLLATIEEQQPARILSITQRLTNARQCSKSDAEALIKDLMSAEKHLLQTLIGHYLLEQPIATLYDELCVLLDRYLSLIDPSSNIQTLTTPSKNNTEETDQQQSVIDDGIIDDDPSEKTAEPDWGDVFD